MLACWATAVCSQQAADPYAGVLNEPANDAAIENALNKLSANGCVSKDCLAFKDISRSMDVLLHLYRPNSLARTSPVTGDPYAKANKELRRTLLAHPERKDRYCAILTKLAKHYDSDSRDIGYFSIEIANRISTKSFSCISTVLQAFPDTPEIAELIKSSKEDCIEDRRAGCAMIVRPQ